MLSSAFSKRPKSNLFRVWVFGVLLKGDLDLIGLLQTLPDQLVWRAIGTQRRPVSIPVKLGRILCLDKIWHHHNLNLCWLGSCMGLDCVSLLDHAGVSTSAKNYYNSEIRSSRRADWVYEYKLKTRCRGWVCRFENKVLKLCYNSVFCLVDDWVLVVYFANAPSQLFWEGKSCKPKEEIGNLNGFEYMYLSGLKVPYF